MNAKSTYNFVPAQKEGEVVKPNWADQVSHDIPFSDGESGEIELTITAKTAIFIRDGYAKGNESNEFSHFLDNEGNKQYFIPATSLKGMFRNVLEIISSSRLNPALVNDNRYSFRDLTRDSLYMENYQSNRVKAGWLKEDEEGNWTINECNFYHIHHEEVDRALGTTFRREFRANPTDKSAKYKYKQIEEKIEEKIEYSKLVEKLTIPFSTVEGEHGKTLAVIDNKSEQVGTIVFTGQSSRRDENRDRPSGKVHEFLFEKEIKKKYSIDSKMQDDFKFIYHNDDKNNISPDWEYWRGKLRTKRGIPVFFTPDREKVKHFGLAFMYKLPYEHSIHQVEPIKSYLSNKEPQPLDFAQTIFGLSDTKSSLKGRTKNSLKGRVFFGHAIATEATPVKEEVKLILGSPKASYYPFYLKQPKNYQQQPYYTYQDSDALLRGFKRYPVRSDLLTTTVDNNQNNVASIIKPLESGATFSTKVRFHNLRKAEIGALLSAITFHNHEECYHSIGGAKPYGYGKIEVKIESTSLNCDLKEYLYQFKKVVGEENIKANLRELVAMASNNNSQDFLQYPTLSEFREYKRDNEYLKPFSTYKKLNINTYSAKCKAIERAKEAARIEREKEEAEKEIKRILEQANELLSSENIEEIKEFREKHAGDITEEQFNSLTTRIGELENRAREQIRLSDQEIEKIHDSKFDTVKRRLNNLKKRFKDEEFSDSQKEEIEKWLSFILENEPLIFYRRSRETNGLAEITEYPWTDIVKWIGEKRTEELYKIVAEKLNKQKEK